MEKRFVNSISANSSRLILLFLLVAAVIYCLPSQSAAQTGSPKTAQTSTTAIKSWTGSYSFADLAPAPKRRRRADVAPFTEYTIAVEANGGSNLTATLEISGVQQFEIYKCSVKVADDKADFFFERAGDADSGANNQSSFKKGVLMFALIKTNAGKGTKYLFEPAAYKIKRFSASRQNIVFNKQ